jgi:hypothetical protein
MRNNASRATLLNHGALGLLPPSTERAVPAPPPSPLTRAGLFLGLMATGAGRTYIPAMVRISISPAAFQAIASTLPGSGGVENKRASNGDWQIWLDRRIVDRLNSMRELHEGLSDVILRVAEATAER